VKPGGKATIDQFESRPPGLDPKPVPKIVPETTDWASARATAHATTQTTSRDRRTNDVFMFQTPTEGSGERISPHPNAGRNFHNARNAQSDESGLSRDESGAQFDREGRNGIKQGRIGGAVGQASACQPMMLARPKS
jgi:hypothetical protein